MSLPPTFFWLNRAHPEQNLELLQEELARMEITGEAGAGMVKVTMTGKHEVKNVQIDPSALEEDAEFLEDLIAAAINDAVQHVESASKEKMSDMTGGMELPEGMKFPF